jgi:hypothetical protein
MHLHLQSAGWPQDGIDYMRNVGVTSYASYPYIGRLGSHVWPVAKCHGTAQNALPTMLPGT